MPGHKRPIPCFILGAVVLCALVVPGMAQQNEAPESAVQERASQGIAKQDSTTAQPEEVRKELEAYRRRLEKARVQEKGLARNVTALTKELVDLNKDLIDTAQRIQSSEAKLSNIEGRLEELGEQEKLIRGSLAQRHGRIAKLLAAMQRMGRQPPPVIVTQRQDALRMVRSAMLLASVFPELKDKADELAHKLSSLLTVSRNIQAEQTKLRAENLELTKNQAQIKVLLAEKRSRQTIDEQHLADLRLAAKAHQEKVESLSELLTKLNEEVAARTSLGAYDKALAEQPESETKTRRADDGGDKDKPVQNVALLNPGRIKPSIPFKNARSMLPLPVQGTRIREFGGPDNYGGQSQGLVIQTRDRAQIISPSDGWVVYSGIFRSYGQLLIINAGGGYHILLAGMESINASVGQFVLAGEPVAVMGVTARTAGPVTRAVHPSLYIEFRKDGRPIDPDPWWVADPEKVQG